MYTSTPNPLFYLIADDAGGLWSGVIASWCEDAGFPALALTADPCRATAYLVVARSASRVRGVLDSDPALDPKKPTVWINAFTGDIQHADSPSALRRLVASESVFNEDHARPPLRIAASAFNALFRAVPAHKLQGGFLEGGEFENNRAYPLELSVVFQLGPDGRVWACLGALDDLPPSA